MEIPVLVRSLKSSILSSTSLQRDKTFWGVVSAAVEQASNLGVMPTLLLRDTGNSALESDPRVPPNLYCLLEPWTETCRNICNKYGLTTSKSSLTCGTSDVQACVRFLTYILNSIHYLYRWLTGTIEKRCNWSIPPVIAALINLHKLSRGLESIFFFQFWLLFFQVDKIKVHLTMPKVIQDVELRKNIYLT